MLHNHPSGDPTPSEEDLLLTLRISKAGEMIGIELFGSSGPGRPKVHKLQRTGLFLIKISVRCF